MLYNINSLYLHRVFHGIRFKVNNEDWLSVRIAFFCFCPDNPFFWYSSLYLYHRKGFIVTKIS